MMNILCCVQQELGRKGTNICNKLKKPSAANARALSSLFPSSSASAQKRPNPNVFDPTAECIAIASQKKKKKAIRSRSTKVTILFVDPSKGIPKKNYCRQLRENGYEEIIEVKRNMSSVEIKSAICRAFGAIEYKILCAKDGKFVVGTNQNPTGDELVEIMTKRKSPLYICDHHEGDSDSELPAVNLVTVYKLLV